MSESGNLLRPLLDPGEERRELSEVRVDVKEEAGENGERKGNYDFDVGKGRAEEEEEQGIDKELESRIEHAISILGEPPALPKQGPIDPFKNRTREIVGLYEWIKIVLCLPLLVLRILLVLVVLFVGTIPTSIALAGYKQAAGRPLPQWRRHMMFPSRLCSRAILFCFGIRQILSGEFPFPNFDETAGRDVVGRYPLLCYQGRFLRQRDIPEEKYSKAFLGYGPEETNFAVELTYNYGQDSYDIGTGFGHFGIAVDDVQKTVDLVKAKGGKVSREPGPAKGGSSIITFVDDPDGYKFELIQRPPTREPFAQDCLRVGDLDRAIIFYEKACGLNLPLST